MYAVLLERVKMVEEDVKTFRVRLKIFFVSHDVNERF